MSFMRAVSLEVLSCSETGKKLDYDSGELMVILYEDNIFPLCNDVIKSIPRSKRRSKRYRSNGNGLNIFFADAPMGPVISYGCGGTRRGYWEDGLKLAKFAFSVTRDTAWDYFPNHCRKYFPD